MATIPANNNTGLYNTSGTPAATNNNITVSGNVNANNFNATSQVNAGTNISAAGNVTAGGYFIGDGSLLTGLPASYGNANVAAFLPTYTGNLAGGNAAITNNLTVGGIIYGTFSGNISGNLVVPGANTEVIYNNSGNAGASSNFKFDSATSILSVTGNVTATQFNGSGAGLTNLPGANVTGTVANATYATSAGSATTASTASVAYSVAAANIVGTVANATYATSAGSATTASTASVAYSVAAANIVGTVANATYATTAGSATTAGTVTTAAQPNITSVGTLTSLTTSGNIDVGGSLNTDDVTSTGNVTIYGNQVITGNLTVQGTTTTINSNTITTNDKTITVANNQSTGANVNGAGLEAGNPAVATFLYNDATTSWQSNISLTPIANATQNLGTSTLRWNSVYGNVIGDTVQAAGTDLRIFANGANLNLASPSMAMQNINMTATNVNVNGQISATGNITGSYILGNGSQLTGLPATYSNADVTTLLASFGSNTISTSGNITGGNIIGNGQALTNLPAANIVGTVANATYATSAGTATSATTAGTVTTAAQPNITSVGTLTSLGVTGNITAGGILTDGYYYANGTPVSFGGTYGDSNVNTHLAAFGSNTISTTGNITAGYFIGNGSQLTGIATSNYSNSNVAAYLPTYSGNIASAGTPLTYLFANNIQATSISSPGDTVAIEGITSTGTISAVGNISTGTYFIGNGSQLTGITTSLAGTLTGNIETSTYYIQNTGGQVNMGNVRIHGSLGLATDTISSPSGDFVTIEGVSATNGVTTTANISAGYFLGNGSQLTGITTGLAGNLTGNIDTGSYYIQRAGAEVLMGNVWVTGTFAANSISSPAGDYVQIEGITVTNGMISSGNVQGANLVANTGVFTGTLAATNLVANTQIGNLLFLNQQIQTTQAANVGLATSLTPNPGQIVVGSGYNGNISPAYDITNGGRAARLLVTDSVAINNSNTVVRGSAVQNYYTLNANLTGANVRLHGAGTYIQVGGGASANTMSGSIFNLIGGVNSVIIGGGTSGNLTALGNTTQQNAIVSGSLLTLNAGSTGGNIFGNFSQLSIAGTGNSVVLNGGQVTGAGTFNGNVFAYYNPGSTTNIGLAHSNTARNATNYYAFYNDDDVAQMKLGSLRLFHEYQYALSSSAGALTVNKNNGQVQFLSVSEAITSVTFSNFVTSASTGSTTKYQTDTVTLIVQQDATGRSITLPTPSSTYKYAGGITTIPTTASSVSMVSITALYNTVNAAVQYLITISPEFN